MNFHQKLVVYYILDYYEILFILEINSMLREFILWDQRLLADCFVKNSEGLRYCCVVSLESPHYTLLCL